MKEKYAKTLFILLFSGGVFFAQEDYDYTSPNYSNPDFSIIKFWYNDSFKVQLLEPSEEIIYAGQPNYIWLSQQGYSFVTEEKINNRKDSIDINLFSHSGELVHTFRDEFIYGESLGPGARQNYVGEIDQSIIRVDGVNAELFFTLPPYTNTKKISLTRRKGLFYDDPLFSTMNKYGTKLFIWGDDSDENDNELFSNGCGIICYSSRGEFLWKYEFEDFISSDEIVESPKVYVSPTGNYCVAYILFYEEGGVSEMELMTVVLDEDGKHLYNIRKTGITNFTFHEESDILEITTSSSESEDMRSKVVFLQLSTGKILRIKPKAYMRPYSQ